MKKEIEKWLSENNKTHFIKLSQEEEFIDFLLSLISVTRKKAVSDVHQCAIGIADEDIDSFSRCLNARLNNPNPEA